MLVSPVYSNLSIFLACCQPYDSIQVAISKEKEDKEIKQQEKMKEGKKKR